MKTPEKGTLFYWMIY